MSSGDATHRLNPQALAERGGTASGAVLLQKMERLTPDLIGLEPDSAAKWAVRGELRTAPDGGSAVWMQLTADAVLPLTCQRCMGRAEMPVRIDTWYRFVDNEDTALAEDDASEEDLLVLEPQLDLTALLEDELLLALPVVPLHDQCPVLPPQLVTDGEVQEPAEKPNPFAALARLKKP
jgi:uncharacterized protein